MQKRFPYILKTTAILLFFPLFLLGQDTENKTNAFGLKNVTGLAYFEDPNRALTFDDILDKQFVMGQAEKPNIQSKYWYRLSIPEEANRKLLFLYLIATDFSDIYVPVKGSETYERHTIGHFAKREKT
ncbi:MAG: 7TM-DISM domain-containing protein [Moheibacter sp.]